MDRWDNFKNQVYTPEEFKALYEGNFTNSQNMPAAGDLVKCGGCHAKMTPYTPPYPPDECLCDECEKAMTVLRQEGEI